MAKTAMILGIDLEGINEDLIESGVNLEVDRVIEIGAVLWDCQEKIPVKILSELIDEDDRLSIGPEVQELTGLNDTILEKYGHKRAQIPEVLERLAKLMQEADYLMAHNGKVYDRPMLEEMFKRHRVNMPDKVWIDTMTDIEFPKKITLRSMAILEHSHGFINPFPHRAITDVLAMLKIASHYDIDRIAQLAKSPMATIIAQLDAPNWKNRAEVESFNKLKNKIARARFKWNPQEKIWSKEVHQLLIDEGKIDFQFNWYRADQSGYNR